MRAYRMPLRIVFYTEDDAIIAHCLELGIVGDGATREEALASLSDAIQSQWDFSVENNNMSNFFRPAEPEIFEMFANGEDCVVGEMTVERTLMSPTKSMQIQGMSTRQFAAL